MNNAETHPTTNFQEDATQLLSRLENVDDVMRQIMAAIPDLNCPVLAWRKDGKVQHIKLKEGQPAMIGRATCPGMADAQTLSREHFSIQNGHLKHLSQTNPTYVNTKQVVEHRLCDGDIIDAGKLTFFYLKPMDERTGKYLLQNNDET